MLRLAIKERFLFKWLSNELCQIKHWQHSIPTNSAEDIKNNKNGATYSNFCSFTTTERIMKKFGDLVGQQFMV